MELTDDKEDWCTAQRIVNRQSGQTKMYLTDLTFCLASIVDLPPTVYLLIPRQARPFEIGVGRLLTKDGFSARYSFALTESL